MLVIPVRRSGCHSRIRFQGPKTHPGSFGDEAD